MASRDQQRTPTRAPTTDVARTQLIERGPKAGAAQGPMTLPRTKFDASTDPREKSQIEALRRRFEFTDEEVEAVSPSKPVRATAAAASASSGAPSEAERARLLGILEQQRENLASLQEKKRRLESAQEEFSKIDMMLSDVLTRSSRLNPSDMAQAARYLSALSAQIPSVPSSAASSVGGDELNVRSRTESQASSAAGQEEDDAVYYQDEGAESEDLASGLDDPELVDKLRDLQAKNDELRRLQNQLQALRGMQSAMMAGGAGPAARPALAPTRPAPPPPAPLPARLSASASHLPARAGGPYVPGSQRSSAAAVPPPPPPRAARDPAQIQADLRAQLEALQAITARAAALGLPQGNDNDDDEEGEEEQGDGDETPGEEDQQSVASSANQRASMAEELTAKREQLRMLENKLAELHKLRELATSEHAKNISQLAMIQNVLPGGYAAAAAASRADPPDALAAAAARFFAQSSGNGLSLDRRADEGDEEDEDDAKSEETDGSEATGESASEGGSLDPYTTQLLQRLRAMRAEFGIPKASAGALASQQQQPPRRPPPPVPKPAAAAAAAGPAGDASALAAMLAGLGGGAAGGQSGSTGRLQGLLQSLKDQQQKLRELQDHQRKLRRAYVVENEEGQDDDDDEDSSPTGDQERQMYLPGRISPRSGSVSVVSANGASTAPTLGTLDVSTRIGRLDEQDEAWSRPPARDEGLPVLSGSFVMREISHLRQRMDHITDQLENLTARLPPPAQGGRADESSMWEEESYVTDELLRGKLELQSMRLATEYRALLPPAARAAFMKEFSHFFSNPATSSRAFRLALRVLPDALDLSEGDSAAGGAGASTGQPSPRSQGYAAAMENEAGGPSDPSEPPLFGLVKDEIYRDVALFITANEDRPQFLQDLFALLQDCSSDYLRQRCLNALQDVFASVLREDSVASSSAVSLGEVGARGGSLSGLSESLTNSRPTTAVRLSAVQPGSLARGGSSSTPRSAQAAAASAGLGSAPGSGIRTRPEVADRVGYDYGVAAADSASLATPADDVSIVSSAATDDPVFGKDPLAETAVFQGSGGIAAAAAASSGAFDQVLARLDESLRRSALEDRTQYPEDLLASGGEGSDIETQTISTIDTSMDRGGDDVDEVQLLTNIHKYFASLPADGVVDATLVDRVMQIVETSLAGPLPSAIGLVLRSTLAACVGQPVHLVGAVVGQKIVDMLYTLQGGATESDAELDNRRDDDLAAAYDVPESDTQASPAAAAAAAASGDATAAEAATPMAGGKKKEGAEAEGEQEEQEENASPAEAPTPIAAAAAAEGEEKKEDDDNNGEAQGTPAPTPAAAADAAEGAGRPHSESPTTDATPTQASTPDAV